MRRPLKRIWLLVRSSHWFVPSLLALGAVALALGVVPLDAWLAQRWPEPLASWLAIERTDARALVQMIASATLTVAGVIFSITMVAIANVSTSYGPLIIETFRDDRGSQVTLGVFIATFLFALLVARGIAPGNGIAPADPRLSVSLAVLLAVVSTGFLIYYINHVVKLLSIPDIVTRMGTALRQRIDEVHPPLDASAPPPEARHDGRDDGHQVRSRHTGHVQEIERARLAEDGRACGVCVELHVSPGDFVFRGTPLATLRSDHDTFGDPQALETCVHESVAIGHRRAAVDDIELLINQLAEIIQRALSPSLNDARVAMLTMNWLGDTLHELARYRLDVRCDSQLPRVTEPLRSFEDYCELILGRLTADVRSNLSATLHLIGMLGKVALTIEDARRREHLLHQMLTLRDESLAVCQTERDVERVCQAVRDSLETYEAHFGGRGGGGNGKDEGVQPGG